jgi:hypothetical protein
MRNSLLLPLIFLILIYSVPNVLAQTDLHIEEKINNIAKYAEEYEVGNINYLQLNVYAHAIKAELNLILGGGIGREWGRIPKENIEKAFGKPTEMTHWVWVENKKRDERLDEALPMWERIVFDGRKVQIIFNAWPHVIENEDGTIFKFYDVDLRVRFKKKFEFDVKKILDEIEQLVFDYNMTRTREAGELLVKKMLEYERLMRNYIQQNVEHCIEILQDFFSPDERLPEQKIVQWNVLLYKGENIDLVANIDMCDECEWHWVNIDIRPEGRGPRRMGPGGMMEKKEMHREMEGMDKEKYREMSIDQLNNELKETISNLISGVEEFDNMESQDFSKYFQGMFKIHMINRILDEK